MVRSCALLVFAGVLASLALSEAANETYTLRSAEVEILMDALKNEGCDVYQTIIDVILGNFIYYYDDGFTVIEEVYLDIVVVTQKAVASSTTDGLLVNVLVTNNNVLVMLVEYKTVTVMITFTQSTIIIVTSIQAVDGCTCSTISYDLVAVFTSGDDITCTGSGNNCTGSGDYTGPDYYGSTGTGSGDGNCSEYDSTGYGTGSGDCNDEYFYDNTGSGEEDTGCGYDIPSTGGCGCAS